MIIQAHVLCEDSTFESAEKLERVCMPRHDLREIHVFRNCLQQFHTQAFVHHLARLADISHERSPLYERNAYGNQLILVCTTSTCA